MDAYLPMIKDALGMFLFLGAELSILFILISAGVSLLQQYIPDSKVQSLLGASKGRGYVLAAALGAITPFCTCSTIPMLRGLLRAKAGFGPTLTFLFSSPLLNPIIIGLFVVTFGIKVTVIYTTIALILSVLAGIVLSGMGFERYVIREALENTSTSSCCGRSAPAPTDKTSCCASTPLTPLTPLAPVQEASSSCCAPAPESTSEKTSCCAPKPEQTSCCGSAPHASAAQDMSFGEKIRLAFADGYAQFKQVLPYLLLGISLGAVIYGFVPSDFIAKYASGDSLLAVPLAAVIGIPLYVRVEALIPLSAVLIGKGMGLGPVMALIIGGGGASLTEVILLKSLFRWPVIAAFLAVVLCMAVGAGYLFQYAF